jgi:hypothetical protein
VHLRRGVTRLYIVVAVPWVAWYGYQILDAAQRSGYASQRAISHAFWLLLIVPIGGPILLLVIVWIIAGFRKSDWESEKTQDVAAHNDVGPLETFAPRSSEDYCAVINRAVANLTINDRTNRQRIYERARTVLHSELRGQDRSRTKYEWKSFEKAIHDIENAEKRVEPASTALLCFSILFPSCWMLDCSSMSLYWVARLPKIRT